MSTRQPVYELYEWERQYRDIMLDGLGVVKFILDADSLTYACRNLDVINPLAYGEALDRFIRANRFSLKPKEWRVLQSQIDTFVKRVENIDVLVKKIKEAQQQ